MNLFKNTLILALVSAALACSGNNQANSAANTANKSNANANKAETNIYKDYPGDAAPKAAPVAESKPKIDDPVPVKTDGTKMARINTKSVLRASSDDGSAFKFRTSKKGFTVAARTMETRKARPVVKPTPTPGDSPGKAEQ